MLYNNTTLKEYCDDNQVTLLENYDDKKINREYYIKGICITNNCGKEFNKSFRQLVKTGAYCYDCAVENGKLKYKLKCKYNLEFLNSFCGQNNITLTDHYTDKDINRDTIIKGVCLTIDCQNTFDKQFRELVKLNGFCYECSKEKGKLKIIETNLKKFGCVSAMQNDIIKDKQKQTMLHLYGVEHNSQLLGIKEQKKVKSLEKYGTEYVLQSEEVKNKSKQTNILKYGVKNPQQNIDIKNKTMETNLTKYGCKFPLENPIIREKMIKKI